MDLPRTATSPWLTTEGGLVFSEDLVAALDIPRKDGDGIVEIGYQ